MADQLSLQGIIPPILTPMKPDRTIDTESLRQLVTRQIEAGVHGVFPLGSTGEGTQLDDDQRRTVLETVIETVAGRVPVLAGILSSSTRRTVTQGQMVREYGVQGVVMTAPYYYTNSQAEIIAHFRAVREAVELPIIAYNIPSMVKVDLHKNTIRTLAEEGTIAALKDTSADLSATRAIMLACRDIDTLSVLTGLEFVTDLALEMGLDGAVPGLANVAPADYVAIYDAIKAGDLARARYHQERMIALFDICYHGHPQASFSAGAFGGFKAALVHLGVIEHDTVMSPMIVMEAEARARVREVLESLDMV